MLDSVPEVFGIHPAMPPDAQSAVANARLDMDLKRLRWIAVAAPLMIVIALEVIRAATAGEVPLQTRLVLDAVVVVAFAIFGVVMVRAIGDINEQLKRQNRELLALHSAGLDVAAELSLDAVLKKVVDQARNLVGAKYGALSVVDAEQGRIKSFLTSGITPEEREAIGPPPVGHGVLGVVLHEGQRLRLEDIAKHPRSVGFPANHPMMRTLLAVPITCKSPFVGNLYLAEKENDERFTDDDEKTLERFAVQAAIAQVLGYVNTKVQAANEYLRRGKNEEASGQLRELAVAAREAYGDVREAIVDLRTLPGPQQSFADAMREYINRWKEQTGI